MPPGLLTLDHFTPHLGSAFAVGADDHEDDLILVEAKALDDYGIAAARAPFSLIFKGSRADLLFDQQTFTLRHGVMGELGIMLTPIGRFDDGTFRYQAVFN